MSWTKNSHKLRPFPAFDTRSHIELTRMSAEIMRSQTSFRRLVEKKNDKNGFKCLINIAHPLRVKWDLFVMFLAIYNCFSIPFSVAFIPSSDSEILLVTDSTIDLLFFLDIILNFRTTYINLKTGDEITNGWLIARNYLLGKFWIDLLATVPFDTIGLLLGASSSVLQLFSLLKLIRILRLNKIILYMRTKEDVKLALKFLQLILFLLMYLHVIGCIWFILVFKGKVWAPPIPKLPDFYDENVWHQYSFALYSSVAMLVGIEVMPQTFEEIVYCSVVILAGAVITAVLFGEMAVIMANINRASTRFNDIMNHVNTTMKNLKLPQYLQYKISDYLVSTQTTLAQQEEYKNFKEEIPPSLRAEVNNVLFAKVIESTPIFSDNPEMTMNMIRKTDNLFFKPEEEIIKQQTESDGMFFLLIGKLEVMVEDLNGNITRPRVLTTGDYFGEIGLLFGARRTATVKVLEYATVAKVTSEDFDQVMENFSDIKDILKMKASQIYHDNLTRNLDKLLKKIPFIRNISEMQYAHILYKLEAETYQKDTVLLPLGEVCNRILFLIEGTIEVHFGMYGESTRSLMGSYLERTHSHIDELDAGNINGSFNVFICEFKNGSIICAKQSLIKAPVPIQITASSFCKVLELKSSDIEKIAYNIEGNLRANIAILRNKHYETNHRNEEIISRAPIIDGWQPFGSYAEKLRFKTKLKFKHAVLKILMKIRQRKKSGAICFFTVVNRLINIAKLQSLSWEEMKQRIEAGAFPTETIDIAHMLKASDFNNPVMRQMGVIAQDTLNFVWRMENKLKGINYMLEELEKENSNTENNLAYCDNLTHTLDQLIKN